MELLTRLFSALSPLWEMSLTAAYAAVILAAARLAVRKRAPRQVLCLLWLVVFARLLIPVSLESPLSIVPDAQQVQSLTAGEHTAPVLDQFPTPGGSQTPGLAVTPVSQGNAPPALTVPQDMAPAPQTPETEETTFPWQALIAGVWLAGAAAMGGYGLLSYLTLRRRLFDAIRGEDGAWEHPSVTSPFILGMLRPRIYLPAGLRGQPRQFILCHERAHLRRCDHIVKPICWAALALHWFNPFVWMSFLLMSRDIEAACDEAVIRQLGPQVKADYSQTLLSLATHGRIPAPCPLAFDEGDAKGRIQNVLRYRRPALWIVVVSIIAAALAAVCLLTDPVSAEAPEDSDPAPSGVQSPEPTPAPADAGLNALLDPWMKEVLDGQRQFLRVYGDQGWFDVTQLREMVYGDEEQPRLELAVGRLALMDLDRDGLSEMIVWPVDTLGEREDPTEIGYYTGYYIFRRQGDTVYADVPGWRSIGNLKADGTFDWSSGAYDYGVGRGRFVDNRFEVENVSWCEPNGSDGIYFLDGEKTDWETYFYAAVNDQSFKPEPAWYTYENGVLRAYRPEGLVREAETNPNFDDGEAKLWLEGGEIPWLEWNGTTSRLDGLITPAQVLELWCRDLDGDGENEAVVCWLLNGSEQMDVYEWKDGRPVLAGSINRGDILLQFNRNNRAAVRTDEHGYGLTITWDRGDGQSIEQTAYLPSGFFRDSGLSAENTACVYANGFHMSYWQREERRLYLDFEVCLADQTFAELSYLDQELTCGGWTAGVVGVGGCYLRYDGAKWVVDLWDQLTMDYPEDMNQPGTAAEVCAHGLDHAYESTLDGTSDSTMIYTAHNTSMVYRCLEDGFTYVLPAPITGRDYWFGRGWEDDFDGDGHIEEAVLQENAGLIMVCDAQDRKFLTPAVETWDLIYNFNQDKVWSWTDDGETLTLDLSYGGQDIRVQYSGDERALIQSYGGNDAPVAWNGNAFLGTRTGREIILDVPIYLQPNTENDSDSTVSVGAASWTFRYRNGEISYVPDSFQLTASTHVDFPVDW